MMSVEGFVGMGGWIHSGLSLGLCVKGIFQFSGFYIFERIGVGGLG